jgi:hypothetical protein
MPLRFAFTFSQAEFITLGLMGVLVVIVALMGYRAWLKSRISPEERERRRRATLVASGKMGDATLTEIRESFLFYAYMVRGVEYTASQDVSQLKERIPPDLSLLGPVALRYDPRNPANSIVVAEEWSGLRLGEPKRPA